VSGEYDVELWFVLDGDLISRMGREEPNSFYTLERSAGSQSYVVKGNAHYSPLTAITSYLARKGKEADVLSKKLDKVKSQMRAARKSHFNLRS